MRTAVTLAAIALAAAAPTAAAAGARNPAASLSVAPPQTTAGQGAGQPAGDGATGRPTLPVPGYQFIAAGLLLGVAAVIFAFTQQDGTPDSN